MALPIGFDFIRAGHKARGIKQKWAPGRSPRPCIPVPQIWSRCTGPFRLYPQRVIAPSVCDSILRPEAEGDGLMNRKELLEAASQHLSTAIILLTVAGEDRLALDVEEIAGRLDFF